ncbi:GntR family transcriptional regulator [Enterococcus sp.]|jgi:GntR family transcriptional regulator|uniref:GntR family transcriptional regulator n=1 Tax=Enterococcus sp. TaxID=35783 RepID=UPI0025BB940B|nr:GntR family transcriptional regulator [Enterococcus sp.]
MQFEIEPQSNIPIYQQLRDQIILGIAKGELAVGELLPSVRQLAEEIGINTMTISKAYNSLKEDGLLITDRRKGTAVATPRSFTPSEEEHYQQQLHLQVAAALIHGKSKAAILADIQQCLEQFSERDVLK